MVDQLPAIHGARHQQIGKDKSHAWMCLQPMHGLASVLGRYNAVTTFFQQHLSQLARQRLVIDQKDDAFRRSDHGVSTVWGSERDLGPYCANYA
ncbi:hypothetical protein XAC3810_620033 [Xanthomonas citri pv. citri]|uniref:Uncharacterized protein n=1 Tax=Xanthomonas citri pv. citri TaxID=611301 RepID=A0A0U5BWN2_XANCI|nr:hypothetical protein XAC9322_600034 [Xanthomonas citri pv. citri]CEE35959.1 hypothetical protein XAC1083_620031 [Xanthomonas citri pv. citri]CEE45185.1 hypothetical protein XAC3810_620033 [Xanthomonas citri pv. citri]CEE46217.1 hypothetical protein XAC902_900004 [Xanthomonas citri pv. citri]CEE46972.1 hypothetical protein XAC2911_680010 [Xanthomonas citri pv. citri]